MSHRKRKHRQRSDTYSNQYGTPAASTTRPDPSLFIVAHEADIIRGPQAARTADSLEVGINVDGQGGSRVGDGLIKWECKVGRDAEGALDIWVDRYDARLLLDALPRIAGNSTADHTATPNDDDASASRPYSPSGGWSDLPSDAEDTFFLTPDETADLHRTKRLRHLDALRTARLRALSPDASPANNNPDANNDADPWGGTDEEPDEQQMELMRRTAAHVVRATNDAQLRARILAHHGADVRFAFLRGRWGRAWARAQADANRAVVVEREKAQGAALGGLTGYGSGSEGDAEDDDKDEDEDEIRVGGGGVTEHAQILEEAPEDQQVAQETQPEEFALRTAQEARRAKAREWAEKRRAAKALAHSMADGNENE